MKFPRRTIPVPKICPFLTCKMNMGNQRLTNSNETLIFLKTNRAGHIRCNAEFGLLGGGDNIAGCKKIC